MAAPVFTDPRFYDERAAYAWVEACVWPEGPVCPHCGSVDSATALQGKSTRVGVYKCRGCRKRICCVEVQGSVALAGHGRAEGPLRRDHAARPKTRWTKACCAGRSLARTARTCPSASIAIASTPARVRRA